MRAKQRVLLMGGTGMLGHALFEGLLERGDYDVLATVRDAERLASRVGPAAGAGILSGVEATDMGSVERVLRRTRPSVVVNCIGVIKQLTAAEDPVIAIGINALFPHQLERVCREVGARMIQISTDCVFSGAKGGYTESDPSDASDLYGRTKYLGEVTVPHAVTLRTSIIGHELGTRYGLVEWFLSQRGSITGFTKAIFSGFTTTEMTRIIGEVVIPKPELSGLYHVSASPIPKSELLALIKTRYGRDTVIEPCGDFVCDRSLDSTRFRAATGYMPPSWPEMIEAMHRDHVKRTDEGSGDGTV